MEKRHFYSMMLLLRLIEAQTTVEYFSQAHVGEPDYTQHDLYTDGIRIHDSSSIIFQVMCEGNAFVLLHQHRENLTSCTVEIRIGVANNSNFGVTINDKMYMNCPARNIVSKSEYRYVWISLANHVISTGSGSIPETQGIRCKERITFEINYISIGTANNTGAHWKFEKTELTRSPTGMIQTLSSPQSIRPSNAPRSTVVTRTLSTSQNTKYSNENSESKPSPTGMTQTPSTSQTMKPSNEEDKETDLDTVYIIVAVVTLSVLISAIALLIFKKKGNRQRKQTGLDLGYNGNRAQTRNRTEDRGIEETQMFSTQVLETHYSAQASTSSNDTEPEQAYNTKSIMEGKQLPEATSNHFESIHVDKRVKTDDIYAKTHKVPKAETHKSVYSHSSFNNCQNKCMLDTENTYQNKHNTSNVNKNNDTLNKGEEERSSVYDHASTRNIRNNRGDACEYSRLRDLNKTV